jgi:hypothetical protein
MLCDNNIDMRGVHMGATASWTHRAITLPLQAQSRVVAAAAATAAVTAVAAPLLLISSGAG